MTPSGFQPWFPILRRATAVFVASAVLLPAPALTASASTTDPATGSNTGGPSVAPGPIQEAGPDYAPPGFKVFHNPRGWYVSKSCAIDLSGIADFTPLDSVIGCGDVEVAFSSEGEKRSVPGSWATWGSPPNTEDATPDIVYALGATAITLNYSRRVRFGGIEAESNPFEEHSFTAEFFSRLNGRGELRGSITRNHVDGNAGAKLFGAKSRPGFKSIVFTSNDGEEFAFAQIRVRPASALPR